MSRHDHPALGAILHRLRGDCGELPPWVILPRPFTTGGPPYKGQSAGFLGAVYDPLMLDKEKKGSLSDRDLKLDAIRHPEGIDQARFDARRRILGSANGTATTNRAASAETLLSGHYDKAFNLMSSGNANRAFDFSHEPAAL